MTISKECEEAQVAICNRYNEEARGGYVEIKRPPPMSNEEWLKSLSDNPALLTHLKGCSDQQRASVAAVTDALGIGPTKGDAP